MRSGHADHPLNMGQIVFKSASGGGGEARPATRLAGRLPHTQPGTAISAGAPKLAPRSQRRARPAAEGDPDRGGVRSGTDRAWAGAGGTVTVLGPVAGLSGAEN
ncbi:hypothetical protein E2C01_026568 [Portunus trituberculatus]|uniref:Uncharacterized protein n=1 Tax=Portunus trituberculatus TaxID=210409 RepID=A0A5B7EII3_PORTR|nr:hypothetical protein [Portunus trituberculatus]